MSDEGSSGGEASPRLRGEDSIGAAETALVQVLVQLLALLESRRIHGVAEEMVRRVRALDLDHMAESESERREARAVLRAFEMSLRAAQRHGTVPPPPRLPSGRSVN